jgi:transposase
MEHYRVTLTGEERVQLQELSGRGAGSVKRVVNAQILLACDRGVKRDHRLTSAQIAQTLGVSERKIDTLKRCFVERGLDECLDVNKKRNREYPRKVDGELEARLVAMSCGATPAGQARWSLRLLAAQVVELNYIDAVSHETVRQVLKKTNSSRGAKSAG